MTEIGFALFSDQEGREIFEIVKSCHTQIIQKWPSDNYKQAAVLTWLCNDFYNATGIKINPLGFDVQPVKG